MKKISKYDVLENENCKHFHLAGLLFDDEVNKNLNRTCSLHQIDPKLEKT